MLTWILIAVVIAAIFGVINVESLRSKAISLWNQYLPMAKKYAEEAKAKVNEAKAKIEDKNKDNKKE